MNISGRRHPSIRITLCRIAGVATGVGGPSGSNRCVTGIAAARRRRGSSALLEALSGVNGRLLRLSRHRRIASDGLTRLLLLLGGWRVGGFDGGECAGLAHRRRRLRLLGLLPAVTEHLRWNSI